jgi:proteasome lid subunit RPN8/RPN11
MIAQARAELPNECCGVLAGVRDQGSEVCQAIRRYPLVNVAASPTRYLSHPDSLLAAHKDMRKTGLDILAVYHSHPNGEPVPSPTDQADNYYENAVHLIISLQTASPTIRGWWLTADGVREAEWDCLEEEASPRTGSV